MEAERRASLKSKRKPLSDCTNILPNRRKNPSSSSTSKIPKSQTLIKPPKPSNFTSNVVKNKAVPPISSFPKSPTSTGSNDIPNFQSVSSIPHSPDPSAPPTPVSEAGGVDCRKSDESERHALARKDKGKMIADTPIIQLSASLTSNTQELSSFAAPGQSSHSGIQAFESPNTHVQTIRDKEKGIADASVNQFPSPFTSKYQMSSSTSGCFLSEPLVVHSQELFEETRRAKGKMVIETSNLEASDPTTPLAPFASHAASGARERPVKNYDRRKHAAGKFNLPLSCPPGHRTKKKGSDIDYDRGFDKSGSHTDPLPVHKKKKSHDKHVVHNMSQEEVEKLKAYYADIDAFELPEEEISESELEENRPKR